MEGIRILEEGYIVCRPTYLTCCISRWPFRTVSYSGVVALSVALFSVAFWTTISFWSVHTHQMKFQEYFIVSFDDLFLFCARPSDEILESIVSLRLCAWHRVYLSQIYYLFYIFGSRRCACESNRKCLFYQFIVLKDSAFRAYHNDTLQLWWYHFWVFIKPLQRWHRIYH